MARQSFYVGAKAIIEKNKSILILKEKNSAKWELPGGRIDEEQSIEKAVSRELNEEIAGAQLLRLGEIVHVALGDFRVENNHRLCLVFYDADVTLPEVIVLSSEHDDYAWISSDNVSNFDLFSTDRTALGIYFAHMNKVDHE